MRVYLVLFIKYFYLINISHNSYLYLCKPFIRSKDFYFTLIIGLVGGNLHFLIKMIYCLKYASDIYISAMT